MERALISACLLGINCRYDGKNSLVEDVELLKEKYILIPVCPEILGGLSTPRDKSGIVGKNGIPATGDQVFNGSAKVVTEKGVDVTDNFLKGAEETLKIAKFLNVKKAFLKSKSPSCGVERVSFFGEVIKGMGVSACALKSQGVEIFEKN